MNIHERLEEVFRNVLNQPVVLSDETSPECIPGWDSVAHVSLMFSLEDEFGVQFQSNGLAGFRNIGELKRFLAAPSRFRD